MFGTVNNVMPDGVKNGECLCGWMRDRMTNHKGLHWPSAEGWRGTRTSFGLGKRSCEQGGAGGRSSAFDDRLGILGWLGGLRGFGGHGNVLISGWREVGVGVSVTEVLRGDKVSKVGENGGTDGGTEFVLIVQTE